MEKLKVIYRKFPEGDVIALFPEVPGDSWATCNSYQHIGQHGSASLGVIYDTKLATPEEYKDLHEEITQIYFEYEIVIYRRYTRRMFTARWNLERYK